MFKPLEEIPKMDKAYVEELITHPKPYKGKILFHIYYKNRRVSLGNGENYWIDPSRAKKALIDYINTYYSYETVPTHPNLTGEFNYFDYTHQHYRNKWYDHTKVNGSQIVKELLKDGTLEIREVNPIEK